MSYLRINPTNVCNLIERYRLSMSYGMGRQANIWKVESGMGRQERVIAFIWKNKVTFIQTKCLYLYERHYKMLPE